MNLYATLLQRGEEVVHRCLENRYGWVQVARGSVTLNDRPLVEGDGVACGGSQLLKLVGEENAEVLLFDLG